jgi:uncharacterized protein YbjT (DUF2867 family)
MPNPRMTVLVVGATGSIGRLVVEEALRQGYVVRALVRTPDKEPVSFRAKRTLFSVTSRAPIRFSQR